MAVLGKNCFSEVSWENPYIFFIPFQSFINTYSALPKFLALQVEWRSKFQLIVLKVKLIYFTIGFVYFLAIRISKINAKHGTTWMTMTKGDNFIFWKPSHKIWEIKPWKFWTVDYLALHNLAMFPFICTRSKKQKHLFWHFFTHNQLNRRNESMEVMMATRLPLKVWGRSRAFHLRQPSRPELTGYWLARVDLKPSVSELVTLLWGHTVNSHWNTDCGVTCEVMHQT